MRSPSAVQPSRATPPPVSVPRSSTARMSSSSGRKPETGGTPTPPGVEFVRYRRSCELDSRQTAPKMPRMDVRAVFRARRGLGARPRMACHPVGQRLTYGRILKPSPVTTKLPSARSVEDHVRPGLGHDGAALGRSHGDWARVVERPAARRSCGGPETRGSEGARPPASLRRGRTECGPKGYAG